MLNSTGDVQIQSVSFGAMTAEQIRASSVVHVIRSSTTPTGHLSEGGVCDARMGSMSSDIVCKTCGHDNMKCPGHFGHIELQLPVPNVHYARYLMQIMRSICYCCSRILIPDDHPKADKPGGLDMKEIVAMCRSSIDGPWRRCQSMQDHKLFRKQEVQRKKHDEQEQEVFEQAIADEKEEVPLPPPPQMSMLEMMQNSVQQQLNAECTDQQRQLTTSSHLENDDDDDDDDDDHEMEDMFAELARTAPQIDASFVPGGGGGGDGAAAATISNIDAEQVDARAEALLAQMTKARYCGALQPVYSIEKAKDGGKVVIRAVFRLTDIDYDEYVTNPDTWSPPVFSPRVLYDMLRNIPDEDVRRLGLNPETCHPSAMMWQALTVPPNNIRPNRGPSFAQSSDLTVRLRDIVKVNIALSHALQQYVGTEEHLNTARYVFDMPRHRLCSTKPVCDWRRAIRSDLAGAEQVDMTDMPGQNVRMAYLSLVRAVASYQDKNNPAHSVHASTARHALHGMINGKRGAVRETLRKRQDQSGRAVVTPAPYIHPDTVLLPLEMAMTLTIPCLVTPFNRYHLKCAVMRGPRDYPGANSVHRLGSRNPVDLSSVDRNSAAVDLAEGDTVYRHVRDGDLMLVNRQPTLHMYGIRAHVVRVHRSRALGVALQNTEASGMDFDGDECNGMPYQWLMSSAEMLGMLPSACMLANGKPIVPFVQNSVLGLYLMTRGDEMIPVEWCDQMQMQWEAICSKSRVMDLRSGPECYAAVRQSDFVPEPVRVFLSPGARFVSGRRFFATLCPPGLYVPGLFEHGQLHIKRRPDNGSGITKHDLNGRQGFLQVVCTDYGSAFGCDWLHRLTQIANMYAEKVNISFSMDDLVLSDTEHEARLELDAAREERDRLIAEADKMQDEDAYGTLEKARHAVGGFWLKHLASKPNSGQHALYMSGAKGASINVMQNNGMVGLQTMGGQMCIRDRHVLSHFHRRSATRSESHGLVRSAFVEGPNPTETFVHHMPSRAGLVSSAHGTSVTGTVYRKMYLFLGGLTTDQLGAVTNSDGQIVSMMYGHDGFDPDALEHVPLRVWSRDSAWFARCHPEKEAEFLRLIGEMTMHAARLDTQDEAWRTALSPVPFPRLLKKYGGGVYVQQDGDHESVMKLFKRLPRGSCKSRLAFLDYLCLPSLEDAGVEDLPALLREVERFHLQGLVPAGHPVGQIASQSVGEPMSQNTLSMFHHAGIKTSGPSGVASFKHLMNGSSASASSLFTRMHIYFDEQVANLFAEAYSHTEDCGVSQYKEWMRRYCMFVLMEVSLKNYISRVTVRAVSHTPQTIQERMNLVQLGQFDQAPHLDETEHDGLPGVGRMRSKNGSSSSGGYVQNCEDLDASEIKSRVRRSSQWVFRIALDEQRCLMDFVSPSDVASVISGACAFGDVTQYDDPDVWWVDVRADVLLRRAGVTPSPATFDGWSVSPPTTVPVSSANVALARTVSVSTDQTTDSSHLVTTTATALEVVGTKRARTTEARTGVVTTTPVVSPKRAGIQTPPCVLQAMQMLRGKKLRGLPDISDYTVTQSRNVDQHGNVRMRPFVITVGSNLESILCMPYVDCSRTTSTHVADVERVMGIMAARSVLSQMFRDIFTRQTNSNINQRHIDMIVSCMVQSGTVCSIGSTSGTSAASGSSMPLRNAAQQAAVKNVIKSVIQNQSDELNDPQACMMMNRTVRAGTGNVRMIHNSAQLKRPVSRPIAFSAQELELIPVAPVSAELIRRILGSDQVESSGGTADDTQRFVGARTWKLEGETFEHMMQRSWNIAHDTSSDVPVRQHPQTASF